MANANQTVLLQLLSEIDEACRSRNIVYSLFERTAYVASKNEDFINSECELHIMMCAPDVITLKEELTERKIANRTFEDLSNNPRLAYNTVRYVATDSTCITKNRPVRYENLGLAIVVHPLFAAKFDKINSALLKDMARQNGGFEYDATELSGHTKQLHDLLAPKHEKMHSHTMHAIGTRLYKLLEKDIARPSAKKLYVQDANTGKLIALDRYPLKVTQTSFCGMSVPIPANLGKQLKTLIKEKRDKTCKSAFIPSTSIGVISSSNTPYNDVLTYLAENGDDIRDLQQSIYETFRWRCKTFVPAQTRKTFLYSHALRTRDRFDLYFEMQDSMDDLRQAKQNKDIATLKKLLAKYDKFTEKYRKRGLGFFINQEIFDAAEVMWAETRKKGYAKEVYNLVPEQYKTMNLDEYFAQYR